MPVINTPIQPQYDDAVANEDMNEGYPPLPLSQQPAAFIQQNFVPNGADIKGTALQEQYLKQQQEALDRQQLGVDQYQRYIQNLQNKETQVDLSPLAALADAWGSTPSNLAAAYKRPMSQDEKNNQVMALQEKLQAQKDKIADNRNQALASSIAAYKASKEEPQRQELIRSQINRNNAQGQMMMMPGQKSADTAYGKSYNEWRTGGGYATVAKNLKGLEEAALALSKDPSLSGGLSGNLNDTAQIQMNEKGYVLKQKVETAGMAGLRQTMGSQFTDEEGKRFLSRLYDPRLSAPENVAKIKAAITELAETARAKEKAANHFEQYGTLRGLDTTTMRLIGQGGAPAAAAAPAQTLAPEKELRRQELLKKQGGQ